MDSINLDVPFVVLSTKVSGSGETEKRFFTPFGAIDVTFRRLPDREIQHLEIEVGGDTECWAFHHYMAKEFKAALAGLIWGMLLKEKPQRGVSMDMDLEKVRMHVKGSEIDLWDQDDNRILVKREGA